MNCLVSECSGGTGLVQRCLSDPGSEGCTSNISSPVCHIGEYFLPRWLHTSHFTTAASFTAFLNVYFYQR